jgi:serine/threonine protein kinase/Tfp pilus assembly protein PilF
MGVKCSKCQHENLDDTLFCGKCGTKLPSPEKVEVTETLETPKEELTTGSTFAGRYQIIEELGKGGMGRVYKAHDTKIKEKIAIKLIKPEIAKDKITIERFSNELRLARKIRHKNVCGMFDLGEEKGTHYITMEFVPGEDLRSSIRRFGQLPIGKSISIAKQICEGLSEAHRLGVVHRDLKSNNIMIDKEGNVRIMDFGIARSLEAKGITSPGLMIGTPEYMSPEQVEGKEVDNQSDIYSLGIILYEMVTGRVPFEGDTPFTIGIKHKSEIPKNPMGLNTQVSDDLSRVILRCLEKVKEKRYQSVGEVRSELANIEKGMPITERIVTGKKSLTSREITVTFGLKKLFVPALAIIAVVAIGVLSWLLFIPKKAISPIPDKSSIAVLPFADLSPQKDQEYFCDGLAEELINRLANIENLRVPARASAFSFKGKNLDIQEVGEKLNVEMVLDGSVRKAMNKLRITVELVKAADGYPIWSKIYERNVEDTFALQDEISLAIVDNLKIKLLGEEKTKLVKRYTENIEAYDLYLKGRYFWNKRTEEDTNKSVENFEQAIEIDPAFALAYAGLADCYIIYGAWGFLSPKEAYSEAKKAALKALEIDDLLAEAHNALAYVKHIYDWDQPSAEEDFKHAIALNPSYATAHQFYAEFLVAMGRNDEAIVEFKRAKELDPLSLIINAISGWPYRREGMYDKAIEHYIKTLEMDPDFRPAHSYLAHDYRKMGMHEEALKEYKWLNNLTGMGLTYAEMGKTAEANKVLNKLREQSKHRYVSAFDMASICFTIGENDQGFHWLEKSYEDREYDMTSLKVNPLFDNVRSDPRFKALLKKLNLE